MIISPTTSPRPAVARSSPGACWSTTPARPTTRWSSWRAIWGTAQRERPDRRLSRSLRRGAAPGAPRWRGGFAERRVRARARRRQKRTERDGSGGHPQREARGRAALVLGRGVRRADDARGRRLLPREPLGLRDARARAAREPRGGARRAAPRRAHAPAVRLPRRRLARRRRRRL